MLRAVLIPVVVALVAAGCGDDGAAGSEEVVVAGFYPLAWAAEQVAGEGVEVHDLTPAGAEPHDLEITTDQLDLLERASTVVLLGGGFQPALEEAADDEAVLVLDELGIAGAVADEHDAEHAEEDAGDEGDESEQEALDPHVWLDPLRMADIVDVVAGATGADPADAAAVRAQLEALHQRYERGLARCERDLIVTAHAAFGWVAERYGLREEALTGISPEQEPDPRRLARLADLVREEGVTTIFTEELLSPRVARTLAREAGVGTATLDPIEGAGGGDYVSRMDDNLEALREALGCR
jgi:zinc transport system substrate-binding protein